MVYDFGSHRGFNRHHIHLKIKSKKSISVRFAHLKETGQAKLIHNLVEISRKFKPSLFTILEDYGYVGNGSIDWDAPGESLLDEEEDESA